MVMRTMRAKAFVSSNLEEFGPEDKAHSIRRKVAAALETNAIEPVMWEIMPKPEDMTPRKFYSQYLQECQLYLGLIGLKESAPTADEYSLSKQLGLERWIFVYAPKLDFKRHPQMEELATLTKSETVYRTFTSEEDLITHLNEKAKETLSERLAEYIELRKRRAHEFWSAYVREFLEPLLTELKAAQVELDGDAGDFVIDTWHNIRHRPQLDLDQNLGNKVRDAYGRLSDYKQKWAIANKIFRDQLVLSLEKFFGSTGGPQRNECFRLILDRQARVINTAMQREIADQWKKMDSFQEDLYPRLDRLTINGGHKLISSLIGDLSQKTEFKSLWDSYTEARDRVNVAYATLWGKFVDLVVE
jgi:hypothetical protein